MTSKKIRKPVVIGCRYTGERKTFIDTASGTYWEALPKIEGHAVALQRALLTRPRYQSLRARFNAAIARFNCRVECSINPRTEVMR